MSAITELLEPHEFVVIGHRGAAGISPENTLASFAAALDWHCPMIELDVHRAPGQGSRQLLVIHDQKLDRTTNGQGRITDFELEYLRNLDAGDGQQIPLLDEVLTLLRRHQEGGGPTVALNIELKGQATASPVADFIKGCPDWPVLVSSFDHEELRLFRSLDQHTPVAPLYDKYADSWPATAKELDAVAVNLSRRIANPARVAAMRDADYMVFVYTVNDLNTARRLKDMGASGVFTDRPDRLFSQGV